VNSSSNDVDLLGSDPLLDALADIAATVTNCPMASVSLARGDELWFKGRHGITESNSQLEGSLCGQTLRHGRLFEVPDLQADPGYAHHPLVHGPPYLRFYACVPLQPQGRPEGTLCVMGSEPMRLQPAQAALLHALARCAEHWLRERRAVAEALGRLSHEMRTPLNGVLGFAQLLLADTVPGLASRQREWVQHLHQGGLHLLSLVEDMLLFSRLQLNGKPLEPRPIALHAVVQRSVGLLQPLAASSSVRLSTPQVPEDAQVCADERALQQVLVNLLSNAVKYNRSAGTVTVTVEEQPDTWLVGIRDEGAGMTPEQVARLFRPFDRLGAERSSVEGHGLGLAIARMLADAMHASLHVRSTPGQGSLFTVGLHKPQP
jgi:signal transduction histidine kinase